MNDLQAAAINASIRTIGMRHRALAGSKLAAIGLSVGQEALIAELFENGPRSQAQLAAASGCEPPTITSAVQKMEARGLVRRTPSSSDRRAMVVELSEQGHTAMAQLTTIWRELAEETVAGMTTTSVEELVDALTDLAGSLSRRKSSPEDPSILAV
ncbi:MarR family winged helix-turn-helix transcriptional regulator [Micrococcaceae bacterium Sec5.7]